MEEQRRENELIETLDAKIKNDLEDELDHDYDSLMQRITAIASPLADFRLTFRISRLLKKYKDSKFLFRGSKAVTRCLKKNMEGIVILGGDTFPIDLISHIPLACEDRGIPYCYVPSGIIISRALQVPGATTCAFLQPEDAFVKKYEKVKNKIMELPLPA